jgi:DNA-binding transcriptional ArsR family regulator
LPAGDVLHGRVEPAIPDQDLARRRKAIAHPLRAAILQRLCDHDASPIEVAREMGEPLANVSYHVRALHKLGALALVRDRHVRRAVEHTYTATVRISLTQTPL